MDEISKKKACEIARQEIVVTPRSEAQKIKRNMKRNKKNKKK
jgi:hypothetical protein